MEGGSEGEEEFGEDGEEGGGEGADLGGVACVRGGEEEDEQRR